MSHIPHFQPKTRKQYFVMMGVLVILTIGTAVGSAVWRFSGTNKARQDAVILKATKFHDRDMDDAAIEVLKAAIATEEQKGNGNDPGLVHVFDFLGSLCQLRGRDAEAEAAWRRALALRLRELGSEHPEVLDTSDKLAAALKGQKKYEEAEKLLKQSLAKREEYRGSKDDPGLLGSINRLAELYMSQEKWAEAEEQARRAVAIGRATMGLVPPSLADSLRDLGAILVAQQKPQEAEPLQRRALAMREAQTRRNEIDIRAACKALAETLRKLGKEKEAKEFEARAVPPNPSVELEK